MHEFKLRLFNSKKIRGGGGGIGEAYKKMDLFHKNCNIEGFLNLEHSKH